MTLPSLEGYYWVCKSITVVVAGRTVEQEEWLIAYYCPENERPWTTCGSGMAYHKDSYSTVGVYLGTDPTDPPVKAI